MRSIESTSRWPRLAGLTAGAGVLAFTVACGSAPNPVNLSAQAAPAQPDSPVVVACEPHQRALVRPAVINGSTVSQVECVAAAAASAPVQTFAPVAQAPVYAPAPVVTRAPARPAPAYSEIPDAQVVQASSPAPRTVPARQVIYEERPVKKTRSVAKSAVIIGSSAGAGAGVGAAVGGKKGALIGAAIGGGGAAVWDQITRRK